MKPRPHIHIRSITCMKTMKGTSRRPAFNGRWPIGKMRTKCINKLCSIDNIVESIGNLRSSLVTARRLINRTTFPKTINSTLITEEHQKELICEEVTDLCCDTQRLQICEDEIEETFSDQDK
ncbi:hypothetical protein ACOME3_003530 [Neoechinorhynchus agilis]